MIIPNKYSGYQAGIRLYPSGGGGGGSAPAPAPAPAAPPPPPPPPWANMGVNTQQGYNTLQSMKGVPWEKSGTAYNELLNQGFTSNQIRDSASQMYGKPSDSNWSGMVQNAGMTSPTGRPMAGSDQFYQPIYQSQYQNYANPYTAFNVSTYGTQPMQSPISASGASRENISNAVGSYIQNHPNADMNTMAAALRGSGMNPYDVQTAGGFNNYGPQMSMPSMQTQMPFNPYTNSSGYGGGFGNFGGGNFGGGFGGGFDSGYGGFMPQMQSPYSYQPQFQPQMGMGMGMGMQTPFSSGVSQPAPQSPLSSIGRAIVGRSSQMRGTPNVMRRAEGGIASLMDDE